jgi:hypothetical protein
VVGVGTRRTDPEATKRVLNAAMAETPEGVEYAAARAAMRAIPPCRCDRLRRPDPVDAVRWFEAVTACKARIASADAAYVARSTAMYDSCRQWFGLREGETIADNTDALREALAALQPGELLRPDGSVEIDPVATAAMEAARVAAEQEQRRAEYLDAKIAELDAAP